MSTVQAGHLGDSHPCPLHKQDQSWFQLQRGKLRAPAFTFSLSVLGPQRCLLDGSLSEFSGVCSATPHTGLQESQFLIWFLFMTRGSVSSLFGLLPFYLRFLGHSLMLSSQNWTHLISELSFAPDPTHPQVQDTHPQMPTFSYDHNHYLPPPLSREQLTTK